jgi:hypothetical protein
MNDWWYVLTNTIQSEILEEILHITVYVQLVNLTIYACIYIYDYILNEDKLNWYMHYAFIPTSSDLKQLVGIVICSSNFYEVSTHLCLDAKRKMPHYLILQHLQNDF